MKWFISEILNLGLNKIIPNVVGLPGNLRSSLTTDHHVSWSVTLPIFSTFTIKDVQCGLLAEEDPKTVKKIVEENWQQMS